MNLLPIPTVTLTNLGTQTAVFRGKTWYLSKYHYFIGNKRGLSLYTNYLTKSENPGEVFRCKMTTVHISITSTLDVIFVDHKMQKSHTQFGSDQRTINLKCWQWAVSCGCSPHTHPFFLSSNSFRKLPPHRTSCPTEVKTSKTQFIVKTKLYLRSLPTPCPPNPHIWVTRTKAPTFMKTSSA